ncbi:hypothetical protein [Lactiplantibacillus plantarum]|uniref:hypothetical protein n=1 Tax=Lactiplantibacillus plantarum TaxID=1590 RepID=UPI000934A34E|nr:hypothetical protein [Lactiplantibacillus plantarum]
MFGKNRTAPVPPHGKRSLSLKTGKASDSLEGFIPGNASRVRISDEVLDSIVDQVEERMLKRSKGKQNTKQPHLRIDIDDIDDTPKVFVDGVEQQEVHHIELGWDGEDICLNNRYRIDFMDSLGRLHGIGQGK